jgi:tetratricopeptide (TPR) repeat protein
MTLSQLTQARPAELPNAGSQPLLPLRRTRSADATLVSHRCAAPPERCRPAADSDAADLAPAAKRPCLQAPSSLLATAPSSDVQALAPLHTPAPAALPHAPVPLAPLLASALPALPPVSEPPPAAAAFINLNVGGTLYSAPYQTLCFYPSMLRSLLSEPWTQGTSRDPAGRLYLDLDGPVFSIALDFMRYSKLPTALDPVTRQRLGFIANFLQIEALVDHLAMLECHSRATAQPSLLHHLAAADACFDCGEEDLAFQHWHGSYAHMQTCGAEAVRSFHYAQAASQQPECPWRLFHHGINLLPLSPAAIDAAATLQALAPDSAMSLCLEAHSYFVSPCPGSDADVPRDTLHDLCERALHGEPRLFLAHVLLYRATSHTDYFYPVRLSAVRDSSVPMATCKEMQLATAEKLLEKNCVAEAHAKYTEILTAYPQLTPALYGLAATLRAQGELSSALATLAKIPPMQAVDPHIHVLHGQLLSQLGRHAEALGALCAYTVKQRSRWPVPEAEVAMPELFLQSEDVAFTAATAHVALQQWPEALQALSDLIEKDDIDSHFLAFQAHDGSGDPVGAEAVLTDCIEVCRESVPERLAEALTKRARFYLGTHELQSALTDSEEAIDLGRPTYDLCYLRLRTLRLLNVRAEALAAAAREARRFFPGIG